MSSTKEATDFLLPDRPNEPANSQDPEDPVRWTKYIAVDDSDEVRGGFFLMEQRGWLNGACVPVANYQSPLSEGIRDARYGMVGVYMLRFVQRRWPNTFVVGMGHADRPLPRLLTAAGWQLRSVPFLFRIVRPARVLRQLKPLQRRTVVRMLASIASNTGAGWIAAQALQWRSRLRRLNGFRIEQVDRWDSWADDIWMRGRGTYSFAVLRDRATLDKLYPLSGGRCFAYVIQDVNGPIGWAACLRTQMKDHPYFGNLTVSTVLDAGAVPSATAHVAAMAANAASRDTDLIITNQSHAIWTSAFRSAGFLPGPSNYLAATSPSLANGIGQAFGSIHVTRGDGDGRIHL